MRWGAAVLCFVAACGFHASAVPDGPGGGGGDAAPGGGDDAPGGGDDAPGGGGCPTTFSSQFATCGLALDGDLTLSGMVTYNTTTHELRVDGTLMAVAHMTLVAKAGDVDAILAHDVHLTSGAGLSATGPLPFAIVASGSVMIDGGASIDVSDGGAGVLPVCSTQPDPGGSSVTGAGGGGGGGYGNSGGGGGGGGGAPAAGGRGGGSVAAPDGPLGGCPGERGGTGTAPGLAGQGGAGGGALYIVAKDQLTLGSGAALRAVGGGGHGGGSINGGGGGGGSGGMIVLEAPHIAGHGAAVAANGGGGGEGADGSASGHDGSMGTSTTGRADGGAGGATAGADGGAGGSRDQSAGETVAPNILGGGGGGGGGVGYVRIQSADFDLGTISPGPTT